MKLALTTRWNARRHSDGEALIEEILTLGFNRIELGYDTRSDLLDGIRRMVHQGAVNVDSLHNFCPVPMAAARPHPELYTFADPDRKVRQKAVTHTRRTVELAAELGARIVVTHCGNVRMRPLTRELMRRAEHGQQDTPRYQRTLNTLRERRDARAAKQFPLLIDSLERLMPTLEVHGVQLGLENLPTWEAFPTEQEMESLATRFSSPLLRYWHDLGHGQIRENLRLVNAERWLDRLTPHLGGMHLHDVVPPARDHVMPPDGAIDFRRFARFGDMDIVQVIEPKPNTAPARIAEAKRWLETTWRLTPSRPEAHHPARKEAWH